MQFCFRKVYSDCFICNAAFAKTQGLWALTDFHKKLVFFLQFLTKTNKNKGYHFEVRGFLKRGAPAICSNMPIGKFQNSALLIGLASN